jgi:hypothetical protein
MDKLSVLHSTNILIHVVAGSIALLIGLVIILTKKGTTNHKKYGRFFLSFLSVVVLTGLIGVFVFGRNTFLLVITVLSAYQGFSGYRTLQTKSNNPQWLDMLVAIFSIICTAYFLYYFKSIGMIWSPIIIYSTVGALLLVVSYDILRYFIPKHNYQNLWLYEHIYKMIGAFTALLAAFSGTVFEKYQPLSQILPSIIGVFLWILFTWYYAQKKERKSIPS